MSAYFRQGAPGSTCIHAKFMVSLRQYSSFLIRKDLNRLDCPIRCSKKTSRSGESCFPLVAYLFHSFQPCTLASSFIFSVVDVLIVFRVQFRVKPQRIESLAPVRRRMALSLPSTQSWHGKLPKLGWNSPEFFTYFFSLLHRPPVEWVRPNGLKPPPIPSKKWIGKRFLRKKEREEGGSYISACLSRCADWQGFCITEMARRCVVQKYYFRRESASVDGGCWRRPKLKFVVSAGRQLLESRRLWRKCHPYAYRRCNGRPILHIGPFPPGGNETTDQPFGRSCIVGGKNTEKKQNMQWILAKEGNVQARVKRTRMK